MKNAFTLKISWCVVLLFLSGILFGQKRYSLSLQVKQGITGLEQDGIEKESNIEYRTSVIPAGEFSTGINFDYSFFKKKYLSLSGGILWSYNSFTREKIAHTPNALNSKIYERYRTYRFQTHAIIFPIQLNTRWKKVGTSFGLVPRYPLKTKVVFEQLSGNTDTPENARLFTRTYEDGDIAIFSFTGSERVALDKDLDLIQYLVGLNLYLNDKISFEFEFKDFFNTNYLRKKYQDTSNNEADTESFNPNSTTISVGLNYRIF